MADKKLLIFDLDETLVRGEYACTNSPSSPIAPIAPQLILDNGDINIWERPHARNLIRELSGIFDYAVWSSASDDYAVAVANHMFKEVSLKFIWGRSRCTQCRDFSGDLYDLGGGGNYWVKDLKKVKNAFGVPLDQMIIIDDSPEKAERNYGNLVPIRPFYGSQEDKELYLLKKYLPDLSQIENIRMIEKRDWRDQIKNKLLISSGELPLKINDVSLSSVVIPSLPRGLW